MLLIFLDCYLAHWPAFPLLPIIASDPSFVQQRPKRLYKYLERKKWTTSAALFFRVHLFLVYTVGAVATTNQRRTAKWSFDLSRSSIPGTRIIVFVRDLWAIALFHSMDGLVLFCSCLFGLGADFSTKLRPAFTKVRRSAYDEHPSKMV